MCWTGDDILRVSSKKSKVSKTESELEKARLHSHIYHNTKGAQNAIILI